MAHRLWRRSTVAWWFLLLLGSLFPVLTCAHEAGLSAVDLRLKPQRLTAHLTFSRRDLATLAPMDTDGDDQFTPAEFNAVRPQLEPLVAQALTVYLDAQAVPAREVTLRLDASDAVQVSMHFPRPPNRSLRVHATLLAKLPRGHRQYVAVRDQQGAMLSEHLLSGNNDTVDIGTALVAKSDNTSFRLFLSLGVEHILVGYDHLLFLFGILLVTGTFRAAAKIVTSFTLAHSLTLALATVGGFQIPTQVIEPLIALSIVYVGLENLLRSTMERRWLLTFLFGLVHGFGFAAVLHELGTGSGDVLVPLFAFNLGVECGQLALTVLALPILRLCRNQPTFMTRYVPACSLLVVVMGGYWFLERVL